MSALNTYFEGLQKCTKYCGKDAYYFESCEKNKVNPGVGCHFLL